MGGWYPVTKQWFTFTHCIVQHVQTETKFHLSRDSFNCYRLCVHTQTFTHPGLGLSWDSDGEVTLSFKQNKNQRTLCFSCFDLCESSHPCPDTSLSERKKKGITSHSRFRHVFLNISLNVKALLASCS